MTSTTSSLRFLTVITLLAGTALIAGCMGPDRGTRTTTIEQRTTTQSVPEPDPMTPPPPNSYSTTTTTTHQTMP
ncbi:MAG: hypothetical protein P4M00_19030 [Azospirillaceae bacterium]|nr:hypothetical protein [Azospirillaceae bacterium]